MAGIRRKQKAKTLSETVEVAVQREEKQNEKTKVLPSYSNTASTLSLWAAGDQSTI